MLEVRDRELAPAATIMPAAPAWAAKDLLDTDTLSRAEIELIMQTAEAMAEVRSRPVGKVATLRGATVVTLFYEQSTRTRASFEVAAKAMGADVVNLTASGSSVEKGETLIDTVRTLEAIGADVVVMRHGTSGRTVPRGPEHEGQHHQRRRRYTRSPHPGAAGSLHDPEAPRAGYPG